MTPNPLPAPPRPAPSPPPGRKTLLVVALALGVPLGLCLLVGGAAFLFESTAKSAPLRPGDHAALVTAADLYAASGNEAKADPALEKTGRRTLIDGSAEVNYEYESQKPPLYVSTSISLEKDRRDAITTYTSQSVGGALGLSVAGEGIKLEERADLLSFGEQSKASLLTLDGKPVGNFFIARKGTRVFMVIFSGVYFDDAEAFREVMAPRLAAFEKLER